MTMASTLETLSSLSKPYLQLHGNLPLTSWLKRKTLGFCMVCKHHLKGHSCTTSHFGKALRDSDEGKSSQWAEL